MKAAKRTELNVGTHVLLHEADGGIAAAVAQGRCLTFASETRRVKGIEVAVIERDAQRGEYLLRLRDGSVVTAHRERIELDPCQYPAAGPLRMHSFPVQFVVLPGPEHGELVKLISDNGGEVVSTSRNQNCFTIHSGGASKLGGSAMAAKVYTKELLAHAIREGDFSKVAPDKYLMRQEVQRNLNNGRRLFTAEEDEKILAFLLEREKERQEKPGCESLSRAGEKLWRMAETAQICPGRTWMSLKERFKKHLELRFHNHLKGGGGSTRTSARAKDTRSGEGGGNNGGGAVTGHVTIKEGKEKDEDAEPQETDMEKEVKKKRKAEILAQIQLLANCYKVPRSVVVHAGVLCSGDLALADRYLMEKDDVSDLIWTHAEDAHLIDDETATTIREAVAYVAEGLKTSADEVVKIDAELHQMLSSRGLNKVQERCNWIHNSE
jgi:hypothetical protein